MAKKGKGAQAKKEKKVQVKKSGKLQRKEPNDLLEFLAFPECEQMFQETGWLGFLQCLKGYHTEVALAFARSFDGYEEKIGKMILYVLEYSIAELVGMELGGKGLQRKER